MLHNNFSVIWVAVFFFGEKILSSRLPDHPFLRRYWSLLIVSNFNDSKDKGIICVFVDVLRVFAVRRKEDIR